MDNTPSKLDASNSRLKIKLKVPKNEQQHHQQQDLPFVHHQENLHSPQEMDDEDLVDDVKSAEDRRQENDVDDDDEVKEEGEIKEDEDEPPTLTPGNGEEVKLKICIHCNKSFSNGKALGGHMRVHALNYKSKKKSTSITNPCRPPSPKDDVEGGPQVEDEGGFVKCEHCPKVFPSMKSLFGHLRSHPERLWRGMKQPPSLQRSAFLPVLAGKKACGGVVVELSSKAEARLRKLGTWRVTGKRGRMGRSPSPVTSSSDSLGSDAKAAADLMLLLAGGASKGKLECDHDDVDEDDVIRAKKGKGKMDYDDDVDDDDDGVINSKKVNKGLKLFDDDAVYYLKNLGVLPNYNKLKNDHVGAIRVDNNNNNDDTKVDVDCPIKMLSPSKIKGIKKVAKINHKIKDNNLDSMDCNQDDVNNNNNKWVCTTCGKSFPTHQALGGHRSSHNKDKYNNNNNSVVIVQTRVVDGSGLTNTGPNSENGDGSGNGSGEDGQIQDDDVAMTGVVEALVTVHKCKICDKTFSSGQALGGHQRCHYVPWSEGSMSPGRSSGQTGRRGQSELFDLNEEPPLMDGDDDDAGDVTVDSSSNKYC